MAFQSKAQARAAFGGELGPDMKLKAEEFAHATPNLKRLPEHVSVQQGKRKALMRALSEGV